MGETASITRERYDAVVVGARCAGAATAMLLAREGLSVLLVDGARHGTDMLTRHIEWRGHPEFKQSAEDAEYYRKNPPGY